MSYAPRDAVKHAPKHREIEPEDMREPERLDVDTRVELIQESCGNGVLATALRAALERRHGERA